MSTSYERKIHVADRASHVGIIVFALVISVDIAVALLLNDLAQLPLVGEGATELAERGNHVLADLDHRLTRGDGAIGLYANEELGHIGMSDW